MFETGSMSESNMDSFACIVENATPCKFLSGEGKLFTTVTPRPVTVVQVETPVMTRGVSKDAKRKAWPKPVAGLSNSTFVTPNIWS